MRLGLLRYRQKPVVAFRWFSEMGSVGGVDHHPGKGYYVHTREGETAVSSGDYVVTDVTGAQSVVDPTIFERTYQLVVEG